MPRASIASERGDDFALARHRNAQCGRRGKANHLMPIRAFCARSRAAERRLRGFAQFFFRTMTKRDAHGLARAARAQNTVHMPRGVCKAAARDIAETGIPSAFLRCLDFLQEGRAADNFSCDELRMRW
jgi:hypothetical protein